VIKKWLTVVAAGLLVAAIALSPSKTEGMAAAQPPGEPQCGAGQVCWQN